LANVPAEIVFWLERTDAHVGGLRGRDLGEQKIPDSHSGRWLASVVSSYFLVSQACLLRTA
jgi:hypothetical protein